MTAPLTADDLAAIKARDGLVERGNTDMTMSDSAHLDAIGRSQSDVPALLAHIDAQADRIATLEAQHAAALERHYQTVIEGKVWCAYCHSPYPCKDARALGVTS